MFGSKKYFQARVILVSKARSLPIECKLDLAHNYYSGLKKCDRDKHSSLLHRNVNCKEKKKVFVRLAIA
jgi:hypothetical protein